MDKGSTQRMWSVLWGGKQTPENRYFGFLDKNTSIPTNFSPFG